MDIYCIFKSCTEGFQGFFKLGSYFFCQTPHIYLLNSRVGPQCFDFDITYFVSNYIGLLILELLLKSTEKLWKPIEFTTKQRMFSGKSYPNPDKRNRVFADLRYGADILKVNNFTQPDFRWKILVPKRAEKIQNLNHKKLP